MVFGFFKKGKSLEAESTPSGFNKLKHGIYKLISKEGVRLEEALLELRKLLLDSDVGITTTTNILDAVKKNMSGKALMELSKVLSDVLVAKLEHCDPPNLFAKEGLLTILLIGVNGAGKTTTCGKLAHMFSKDSKKVLLAAGDTFRAAAISQLQVWGDKTGSQVVSQQHGADSASVIYDAFSSALAKNMDVMIADTAGRLQNKDNLIQELQKIKRVMGKISESAPDHTWLVLDGSIGQNNLLQAKKFHDEIGLSGIIITKLDGSAKGGSIFAIADELRLPIFFVGLGEGLEDLKPFNSRAFVSELLGE